MYPRACRALQYIFLPWLLSLLLLFCHLQSVSLSLAQFHNSLLVPRPSTLKNKKKVLRRLLLRSNEIRLQDIYIQCLLNLFYLFNMWQTNLEQKT